MLIRSEIEALVADVLDRRRMQLERRVVGQDVELAQNAALP